MRLPALLAVLTLTACSQSAPAAAPTPTPTPSATTAVPGPDAFLAFAHAASFGSKDFASAPDSALLDVGNTACDGFADGLAYGRVVQGFVVSDGAPSTGEAEAFTRAAVENLCPQYEGSLP